MMMNKKNTRSYEKILSNKKKSDNFVNFLEDYNKYRAENSSVL